MALEQHTKAATPSLPLFTIGKMIL